MLRTIATARPAHRGFRHNIAFYDTFDFLGLGGRHHCIVTEALGYGMDNLRVIKGNGDIRMSLVTIKRAFKQVLLGLEYLHDVCGIIHAGKHVHLCVYLLLIYNLALDLKFDNIMFRPRDLPRAATDMMTSPACLDPKAEVPKHSVFIRTEPLIVRYLEHRMPSKFIRCRLPC